MTIIAYSYEADYHCPECAKKRFAEKNPLPAFVADRVDQHSIRYDTKDNEGNLIHPIFSTDELPSDLPPEAGGYSPIVCGECHAVIRERGK